MCITAQLPDPTTGYPGGRIVYIDTEGTFRPDRLKPIADHYNLDFEAAMENSKNRIPYRPRCRDEPDGRDVLLMVSIAAGFAPDLRLHYAFNRPNMRIHVRTTART